MGISITFADLPDGLNALSLFDQAFAQCVTLSAPVTFTSGSSHTVQATDTFDVLINKTVANTVQLPPAALRANQPQSVIDVGGNASSFQITILPYGSERIMGLTELDITTDYGGYTLWPIPTGGWYLK